MIDDFLLFIRENWMSFCADIFVTFLGFLLALKGDTWHEKKKDEEDAFQCVSDLISELRLIRLYIDSLDLKNKCYISPLKTPVWDGMASSNKIQLLAKLEQSFSKKKRSTQWYRHLFELYGTVDEFNRWCDLFTEKNYDAMLFFDNQVEIEYRTNCILESLNNLRCKITMSVCDGKKDEFFASIDEVISELSDVLDCEKKKKI